MFVSSSADTHHQFESTSLLETTHHRRNRYLAGVVGQRPRHVHPLGPLARILLPVPQLIAQVSMTLRSPTDRTRTLELVSNEMAVQLRLTDEELEFTSLASSLTPLLLHSGAIHRLLVFTSTNFALLLLIFPPEDQHLTHETFTFGLDILATFSTTSERLAGMQSTLRRHTLGLRLASLVSR